MELAVVKSLVEAKPFTPFKLQLPSNRDVSVPHPEFISLSPTGITAVVWHRDGGIEHIDLRLVSGVKPASESA